MKSSSRQEVQKYTKDEWLVPMNERISTTEEGETEYEYEIVIVEADSANEAVRNAKLKQISEYDTSNAVNSFYLQGKHMWLPLEQRKNMRQSLIALKAEGIETITYWDGIVPITMPVAQFEAIMDAVEVYALQCFNTTAQHKANVMTMSDMAEMLAYNHTDGYPSPLEF